MGPIWIAAGALFCALSVAGGAFGAHGLKGRLDVEALVLWETAARYLMYSGLGLVLIGITSLNSFRRGFDAAALCLFLGSLVFSGTVAALALGSPRWLGAITPIGGVLMIAGFLVFAGTALRL